MLLSLCWSYNSITIMVKEICFLPSVIIIHLHSMLLDTWNGSYFIPLFYFSPKFNWFFLKRQHLWLGCYPVQIVTHDYCWRRYEISSIWELQGVHRHVENKLRTIRCICATIERTLQNKVRPGTKIKFNKFMPVPCCRYRNSTRYGN